MMKAVEQLVENVKDDVELQEKLKAAASDKEAINAALAEAGYAVTVEDIASYAQSVTADLSDEEVEALAGGDWEDDVCSACGIIFIACGAICWA